MRLSLNTLAIAALLMLASCASREDYASFLAGDWQGSAAKGQWCLSLQSGGSPGKGEGAATYRNIYLTESGEQVFFGEGIWFIGAGGRLQLNINPVPLDDALNPVAPEKIRTESFRYLVKSMQGDELVYRELKPDDSFGEVFVSRRVASCDNFFKP